MKIHLGESAVRRNARTNFHKNRAVCYSSRSSISVACGKFIPIFSSRFSSFSNFCFAQTYYYRLRSPILPLFIRHTSYVTSLGKRRRKYHLHNHHCDANDAGLGKSSMRKPQIHSRKSFHFFHSFISITNFKWFSLSPSFFLSCTSSNIAFCSSNALWGFHWSNSSRSQ